MGTINNEDIVNDIISHNGHFEGDLGPQGDPPVMSITRYTNMWGGTAYGLCYPEDAPDRYKATPSVQGPELIFTHVPHADCNHEAGRKEWPTKA